MKMKNFKAIAVLCALPLLGGTLASCSDDDAVKTPLEATTVSATDVTYSSLSFSWKGVASVTQYGYQLTDPDGAAIETGVTHDTEVSFSGLKPATEYVMTVWAYADMDSDRTTSPAAVLKASTAALTPLEAPVLTLDDSGVPVATWTEVEGVEEYVYSLTNGKGQKVYSGETLETELLLPGLTDGDYTFSVYANTTAAGYDKSAEAAKTFTFEYREAYRATGTYKSAWGGSREVTMVAYTNSTYIIEAFYGVEGYDFEFSYNPFNGDDAFDITNSTVVYEDAVSSDTWQVATGVETPEYLWAKPIEGGCKFTGNSASGKVTIGNYYYNKNQEKWRWSSDTFTW